MFGGSTVIEASFREDTEHSERLRAEACSEAEQLSETWSRAEQEIVGSVTRLSGPLPARTGRQTHEHVVRRNRDAERPFL